jgi:inorganic pyrophosphatase
MDFCWEYYKELNPDLYWSGIITPNDYKHHYMHHQNSENRKYKFEELFPDFNWLEYKKHNHILHLKSKKEYEYHYFSIGRYTKDKIVFSNSKNIIEISNTPKAEHNVKPIIEHALIEIPKAPKAEPDFKKVIEIPKAPKPELDFKPVIEIPKAPKAEPDFKKVIEIPKAPKPELDFKPVIEIPKAPKAEPDFKKVIEIPKAPKEELDFKPVIEIPKAHKAELEFEKVIEIPKASKEELDFKPVIEIPKAHKAELEFEKVIEIPKASKEEQEFEKVIEIPKAPKAELEFEKVIEIPKAPKAELDFKPVIEIPKGPKAELEFEKVIEIPKAPKAELEFEKVIEIPKGPKAELEFEKVIEIPNIPKQEQDFKPVIEIHNVPKTPLVKTDVKVIIEAPKVNKIEHNFKNIMELSKEPKAEVKMQQSFIYKPTFGIFLIGFGMPNLDIKKNILIKNLEIIKKWKDDYIIDLYIYIYNPQFANCLNDINFTKYVRNINIIVKPGIVGEFIYQNVSLLYNKYEYVILFLDDIELPDNFDLEKMLMVYNLEKLDILGLPLTRDSPHNHTFMLQNIDMLNKGYTFRQTNFVELFFYFISANRFPKYLRFFTKQSQWCWGLDVAIGCYGLRLGILECYPIKHYFKAASYNSSLPNPIIEFENTKRRLKTIKDKLILRKEKY